MLDLSVIDMIVMEKTTWGVKTLIPKLELILASQGAPTASDIIIYTQALNEFEKHCEENNISSIGRNQFVTIYHKLVREATLNYGVSAPVIDTKKRTTVVPRTKKVAVVEDPNVHEVTEADVASFTAPLMGSPKSGIVGILESRSELEDEVARVRKLNEELLAENEELRGTLEIVRDKLKRIEVMFAVLKSIFPAPNAE